MTNLYRLLSVLLVFTAFIQWYGIGDRIQHALWFWYKFTGYSHEGYITLDQTMVKVTFVLSSVAVIVAYLVCKQRPEHRWMAKTARYSAVSLIAGLVGLSLLLPSPLARLKM
jgi:hypothetical protein